jgi:hypothetical protein
VVYFPRINSNGAMHPQFSRRNAPREYQAIVDEIELLVVEVQDHLGYALLPMMYRV